MLKNSKEKKLANKIKGMLNKRGFIVKIEVSKKTRSVYLKIDNGACPSIRISDHKNNKTKAKFNMIKDYQGRRIEFSNCQIKMFYNFHMVGRLVADMEKERSNRILQYGYSNYKKTRDKSITENYFIYSKAA